MYTYHKYVYIYICIIGSCLENEMLIGSKPSTMKDLGCTNNSNDNNTNTNITSNTTTTTTITTTTTTTN